MKGENFEVWLDFERAEDLREKAVELEEEGYQNIGFTAKYDITGSEIGEFFGNIVRSSVKIGHGGQKGGEGELLGEKIVTDDRHEELYIQEAIPIPDPHELNPRWLDWAMEQLENQGLEAAFYIEGEGQGGSLPEAIESLERNSEIGIEIQDQEETERYTVQEIHDMVY